MAPIVKESEVPSAGAGSAGTRLTGATGRPEETSARPQPVALEVPVSVNGARGVEGSEKREPFSETTKTVLIFANGAVIRLASSVSPGQLLFLTNENTKREVVCQVVKSKNYRNVSGYVELEFTEAATGFWGMRFPGDRTSVAPSAANVTPTVPQTRASEAKSPLSQVPTLAPVKTLPFQTVVAKSEAQRPAPTPPAENTQAPAIPIIDFPRATENKPATFLDQPQAKSEPLRQVSNPDTEALKQETARLQEQLSSLLFAESAAAAKPTEPTPKTSLQPASDAATKVIEFTDEKEKRVAPPAPEPVKQEVPAMKSSNPAPRKSTLDLAAEQVKIPAWLEPLARNAVAPAALPAEPSEPVVSETPHSDEEHEAASVPALSSEGPTPTFGAQILLDNNEDESGYGTRNSGRGLVIATLAAGLVLAAAGGAWYFRSAHPANAQVQGNSPTFATLPGSSQDTPAASDPSAAKPEQSAPAKPLAGVKNSAEVSTETARAVNPPPTAVNVRETEKADARRNAPASSSKTAPVEEQPKKPLLGDVHLAAPTVNSSNTVQEDVAAPGLNLGSDLVTGSGAAEAGLIAGNRKQPTAPVPVGGDVKPARLLRSVSPVYPLLARSQRVSGDVKIDAFIDATGHVTSTKIVSGPVLLHQAAMDAVRQWRYQPAMLDDKPVAMHLTVTVQFRVR
jgi:periplasmic protein TonB